MSQICINLNLRASVENLVGSFSRSITSLRMIMSTDWVEIRYPLHASEIMERWVPGYPNEWTWGEELCDGNARPAIEAIKHSLQCGGQLEPVLLSDGGYVLDGHRRIMAAYELDDRLVPYEIDRS